MATCRECRMSYTRKRIDQSYCGTLCSKKADARELRRARTIYRALYWWRNDRSSLAAKLGHTAANLRFICREVRQWIEEDREAQRLPPPKHRHEDDRGHERKKLPAWAAPVGDPDDHVH